MSLSKEFKKVLTVEKSINVSPHINEIKEENLMISSVDANEALDKVQLLVIILKNTQRKLD